MHKNVAAGIFISAVLLLLLLTSPWSLSLSHPLTIFSGSTTSSSAPPQPFSHSRLQLHNLFQPGMVLQHGVKTRVWGRGKPASGTKALLSCPGLLDQVLAVEPRPGGWQVQLPAQTPGQSCKLSVGEAEDEVNLPGILFGDVWLCSGQSNMEQKLRDIEEPEREIAESVGDFGVRFMDLARKESEYEVDESEDVSLAVSWSQPSDQAQLANMSAICFLTGRWWHRTLGIPIGLIAATWGGTEIEAWMNRDALVPCFSPPPSPRHCNRTSMDPKIRKNCDSALWNAMIAPLRGLAVKGFLWYQGEANSHNKKRAHYACTFPALVSSWRQEFASHGATNPEAPFGFVQLAPYRDNATESGFPSLRWHQTADTGTVPNPRLPGVFMAVSIDTRDPRPHPAYTVMGLHPRYKQVVAERLAVAGLHVAYQNLSFPVAGPFPSSIDRLPAALLITYDQHFSYKGGGGFFLCIKPVTLCDATISLRHWIALLPETVAQTGPQTLEIRLSAGLNVSFVLAYLWGESPVRNYLGAPIYSTDQYRLPSPPWKQSVPL